MCCNESNAYEFGLGYSNKLKLRGSLVKNLTITTADVTAGSTGIGATNKGAGSTSIETTGAVTGTNSDGIYARNDGTSLEVTTGTGKVTGGDHGVVPATLAKRA